MKAMGILGKCHGKRSGQMDKAKLVVLWLVLFSLGISSTCCRRWEEYMFKINCADRLKLAADANTVHLASQQLDLALKYLEENGMTKGHTSVIYNTPDEDVGFWYENLESASFELKRLGPNASQLERSNVLMNLKETILDDGDHGSEITYPSGIEVYPHNLAFSIWFFLCTPFFIAAVSWILHVLGQRP